MAKSKTTQPTNPYDAHIKALYRIKGNLSDIKQGAFPKMGKKRLAKMHALVLLLEEQCDLSEAEARAAQNAARQSNRKPSRSTLQERRAS
ncbi:MAG: hypothetical protein AAF636_11395 [Pseudomonadota bacterium]